MTDAELVSRLRANIIAYKQFQAAQGALRALTLSGVWAFAQPAFPESSTWQLVFFEEGKALEAALEPLEDFYRSQQVRSWRVQVPPGSTAAEQVLGRAGYQPQAAIPAMGVRLEDAPRVAPRVPLEQLPTQEELIPLNGEAFGPHLPFLLHDWHARPHSEVYVLGVREGGRLISGGLFYGAEDTAGIYLVATAPHARGRGLASDVVRGLLAHARERGRAAAVLQATELGHGVYQRLGFRDLGAWTSWMRRSG